MLKWFGEKAGDYTNFPGSLDGRVRRSITLAA